MPSSKADEVLRNIERVAERRFLPIIGPEKARVLAKLVREVNPKRVLEIGTLIGYSTIVIAKELGDGSEIITIEIDEDEAGVAEKNILKAGVKPRIKVIVGDALKVIPSLKGEFDLLFIDADKRKYLSYLKLSEDKLHEGSVVIADNVGIFSDLMKDYLDYVRKSGKYRSRVIRVGGDAMEVSVKL